MTDGSKEARTASTHAGWVDILAAVRRPITLYALILLVTEGALTSVALRSESSGQQVLLLLIAAGIFALIILLVAVLSIRAPNALMGTEWLREPLAESLAEAIVDGLEGGVTNLKSADDQTTTWVGLIVWIERQQRQEGVPEREFRAFLVRGIQDRVVRRFPALKGAIEAELEAGRAP